MIASILAALTLANQPTSVETCRLLQDAYAAALHREGPVHPRQIGPSKQPPAVMMEFAPSFRSRLPLSAQEFDTLAAAEAKRDTAFAPQCHWNGQAATFTAGAEIASFEPPVLSPDGQLAAVELSVAEGIWAQGFLCVMRRVEKRWNGTCVGIWSIR